MGNRMCGTRRPPVEDRLTRPQRILRQPSDVDYKKLRKLILSEKLAPCFDAVDDAELDDLEECPICFFYFPSLNRSTCCAKGICTECFLQMKPSHHSRPAQCPFCKIPCYAVEYRGAKTEEEKGLEQAEEQKVIEAKLRMRSESQIEEQVIHVVQPQSVLAVLHPQSDVERPSNALGEGRDIAVLGGSVVQESVEVDSSNDSNTCSSRHEELNADLEEIMVMEAIWQSLQDSKPRKTSGPSKSGRGSHEENIVASSQYRDGGQMTSSLSLAGGVVDGIATLVKHDLVQQQVSELDCITSQNGQTAYRSFAHESNSMQPELLCLPNSGLSMIE